MTDPDQYIHNLTIKIKSLVLLNFILTLNLRLLKDFHFFWLFLGFDRFFRGCLYLCGCNFAGRGLSSSSLLSLDHLIYQDHQSFSEDQHLNEEQLDVSGLTVEDEVAVKADKEDIGDEGGELGDDPAGGIEEGGDEEEGDDVSHIF